MDPTFLKKPTENTTAEKMILLISQPLKSLSKRQWSHVETNKMSLKSPQRQPCVPFSAKKTSDTDMQGCV